MTNQGKANGPKGSQQGPIETLITSHLIGNCILVQPNQDASIRPLSPPRDQVRTGQGPDRTLPAKGHLTPLA